MLTYTSLRSQKLSGKYLHEVRDSLQLSLLFCHQRQKQDKLQKQTIKKKIIHFHKKMADVGTEAGAPLPNPTPQKIKNKKGTKITQ